jgi:hypothetical protein
LLQYAYSAGWHDGQPMPSNQTIETTSPRRDSGEIVRAPADQGGFRASQRLRPKQPGVQACAPDPLGSNEKPRRRGVKFGRATRSQTRRQIDYAMIRQVAHQHTLY